LARGVSKTKEGQRAKTQTGRTSAQTKDHTKEGLDYVAAVVWWIRQKAESDGKGGARRGSESGDDQ
jgi:hypothetical protein